MSTLFSPVPRLPPFPGGVSGGESDPDDGIHVVSVTPVDRIDGPALLVVVSWLEGGQWVERELELPR